VDGWIFNLLHASGMDSDTFTIYLPNRGFFLLCRLAVLLGVAGWDW